MLERSEVAGPGFLNLYLRDQWFVDALSHVLAEGERFGAETLDPPVAINVEFVSANPTGPLHIGHARQAAYGDALARILELRGYDVTREYYINDYGSQVVKLGESVRALALGEPVPEGGYHGDYVGRLVAPERARELDLETLAREACDACLALIRESLERFGVRFDVWFSERSLHEGPAVERVLEALAVRGETFTHDGALWLRTTAHGDDKDRVLVRSSGDHTYFTSDIAYLEDKRERGFQRLIFVWGADHHGYIARLKAACAALGGEPDALEIVIQQFVHLIGVEGRTAMSKREGEYVTLDELVDEIGVDASRFYLLQRSHDTTVDLDLDLAVRQSADNPVYYVQYAHARIASVLAKAGAGRVAGGALAGRGGRAAAPLGAGAAQAAARLPGRPRRRRRAPRAAPGRLLRAGAGAGVHRLLPRLPRARRATARDRVAAARALGGGAGDDRPRARAARRQRADADVSSGLEAGEVGVQPRRLGRARRRWPPGGGPARRLRRQRGKSSASSASASDDDADREQVEDDVEAAVGRQREHRLAVLQDQLVLDLRRRVALGDQPRDELALLVGRRGLRDLERDAAGHAHHLRLDRASATCAG